MPPLSTPLERLHALAERDRELLVEASRIDELVGQTAALRRRSAENLAALEALPAERAALEASRLEAAGRLAAARQSLTVARAALETAAHSRRDREARVAEAEADAKVAEEGLVDAERHEERLIQAQADLGRRERRLEEESRALEAEAAALVAAVSSTPRVAAPTVHRVPESLSHLDDWGVEARAALLVARSSVAAERERLVAEANAVGSAALGEDVGALGVSQVIRRLESAG